MAALDELVESWEAQGKICGEPDSHLRIECHWPDGSPAGSIYVRPFDTIAALQAEHVLTTDRFQEIIDISTRKANLMREKYGFE